MLITIFGDMFFVEEEYNDYVIGKIFFDGWLLSRHKLMKSQIIFNMDEHRC